MRLVSIRTALPAEPAAKHGCGLQAAAGIDFAGALFHQAPPRHECQRPMASDNKLVIAAKSKIE